MLKKNDYTNNRTVDNQNFANFQNVNLDNFYFMGVETALKGNINFIASNKL